MIFYTIRFLIVYLLVYKIYFIKVTEIIDDQLIEDAKRYSNSKNITEALKIALKEFNDINRLRELSAQIKNQPLNFEYSADELRELNRGNS